MFKETCFIKPVYEVVGCLQNICISVLTQVLTSSFPRRSDCATGSQSARDTIAMLQWSLAFDKFPL